MPPSTSASQSAAASDPVSWFALVAPVVGWSGQELASFYAAAVACDHGTPALARVLACCITILALAVTLSATAAGYRSFRRISGGARVDRDEGQERREMVALVSVFLGVVLTLAVIWGALPSLLVSSACGARE